MVRCGTMSLLSRWGCMRKPKKLHHASAKNRRKPLATRRPSPTGSEKKRHKSPLVRAATLRAAAPRISGRVEERAAVADADGMSRPSEIDRQLLDASPVPAQIPDVDHRKKVGVRTGIVEQHPPFLPSAAFTNFVGTITRVTANSTEWFNLLLRCTERSLDAIQIFTRSRTPVEFFITYSNLLSGNLNDAFGATNNIFRQSRR